LIGLVSHNVLFGKFFILSKNEYQESFENKELKFVQAEINLKNGKLKPPLSS